MKVKFMHSNLTDWELYKKCQEIGNLCLKYRKQFLGLLPEVERRKLYLQHGMHSIYEFAAKLAGVSREVVNEVLRIHRLLNNAPILQEKLVSGEIPYTKLRPIAKIVIQETEKVWLEKVETMSRPTLEVYVKEMKEQEKEHPTGSIPVGCGSLPWKAEKDYEILSMKVNRRTAAKMRVLKQRFEKKLRKPLNWDETLQEILKLAEGKMQRKTLQRNTDATKRYIPATIRNQVLEKNQGICDAPNCNKPGIIFHHVERLALKPEHKPEKIKYLCKAHERIAHHSLIKNEEDAPKNWQFLTEPDKNHPKYLIDSLVQKFRMGIM
jgi:hypothetical protein